MSLVANCLARLVKSGEISQGAADAARALHEGAQGKLGRDLPPDRADAAAALEAARIMAESAKRKKLSIAKTAIALRSVEDRAAAHSKGPIAGYMSMLVRDIHDEGGMNVESQSEVILGSLLREAGAFIDKFQTRAAGLVQNHVSTRNAVLEMRGKDTGDAAAKEAAGAMSAAIEKAFNRARAAGIPVDRLDDWMTPQFWDSGRLRKFDKSEWIRDIQAELDKGTIEIDSRAGFEFSAANRLEAETLLNDIYDKITLNKGRGKTGGLKNYQRLFHIRDADAYARLMDKWGTGQKGYYAMMTDYLQSVSREISLAEVLGPNHAAIAKHMVREAEKFQLQNNRRVSAASVNNPVRSAGAIDRTYRYLTGDVNSVESEMMAMVFGGLRNISTAAKLGSAAVTAVPGDLTTSAFASAYVGMSPFRMVRGLAREAVHGRKAKETAARLNIVAHGAMDAVGAAKRFEDEVVGAGATGRIASLVIRASGLAAWTNMLKRVYTMELLGYVAGQTSRNWNNINPKFRRFLKGHSIDEAGWEELRAAPLLDVDGAKFFDTEAVSNREVADQLLGAVIDERHFAVVEPDARVRQITTGGYRRGTFGGEIVRSASMFKSFGMSVILSHVKRATASGPWPLKAWRTASFMVAMGLAGGVALQLRSPLKGEDFRDPADPEFLIESFFYGGGAGIYGDLIHQKVARGEQGVAELAGGPVAEAVNDLFSAPFETYRRWSAGKDQQFGKRLANFMSRYMPGSSLWYTRLLIDRYIFDQIQALLDPDYFDSFAREAERLERRSGQRFFWEPGQLSPERFPEKAEPAL